MAQPESALLSVVVVIVSDTVDRSADASHLTPCLQALLDQTDAPLTEIIVPYHTRTQGMEEVKRQFPNVRFLAIDDLKTSTGLAGNREHHDELRARGLAIASGQIVALIEDHGIAQSDWSARVMEAHRQNYAGIGGAIENGIDRSLNWAVYFCDFGRYQNPLPSGESTFASDANIAYKRVALEAIRPVWTDSFSETAVNAALLARGDKLALSPHMVLYQHRQGLRLSGALKERIIWGRSYAAARCRMLSFSKRGVLAILSPVLPGVLLSRMFLTVRRRGRLISPFLKALPFTALLTMGWCWGEFLGYVTGRAAAQNAR